MSESETWSFYYSTHYVGNGPDHMSPSGHKMFTATDDKEAKEKVLELVKKFVKRLRKKDCLVYILAAPYINYSPENERNIMNGDRQLRLRREYRNKRVLRIKNPEVVFAQGYGQEQFDQT